MCSKAHEEEFQSEEKFSILVLTVRDRAVGHTTLKNEIDEMLINLGITDFELKRGEL